MPVGRLSGRSLAAVAASLVLVAAPLGVGTVRVVRDERVVATAQEVASDWAARDGWRISDVFVRAGTLHVVALGDGARPDGAVLRSDLDAAGLVHTDLELTLVTGTEVVLEGR